MRWLGWSGLLLGMPAMAAAQGGAPACSGIENDKARLQCYDRAFPRKAENVCSDQAINLHFDRKLLAYRSLNGKTVAEVLRSVQIGRSYKFEVQSVAEITPTDDCKKRVAICYWLGDVQRVEQEATCGIRVIYDATMDKWIADPGTRDLSDPLLSGEVAFGLALDINFKQVCGTDPERSNREC